MITDTAQRYALAQCGNRLWRYGTRFRTYRFIELAGDKNVFVFEGNSAVAVVVQDEATERIEVTVRTPNAPEMPIAKGFFADGKWTFSGEHQAWQMVPEYVLIPTVSAHRQLLRIADGAEIDTLDDIDGVLDVVHVPNSRLVLLVTNGGWTVYDPVAKKSFGNHELAGGQPEPLMRFRNPDEVWVNDVDTILKIESKRFGVLDAAGSDVSAEIDDKTSAGRFGRWTFAAAGELCVVPRPALGDVMVLDAISMLPVARGVFRRGSPVDALMIGRNTLIAVGADGVPLRTRARRVKVPSEWLSEAAADHQGEIGPNRN